VDEAQVLAAAQRIHDELGASELRAGLAELLEAARQEGPEASRAEVIDRIYELLCRDERTRWRLDEFLPPARGWSRSYEQLAGDPLAGDDSYDRLVCPQGDYAWPILDVADPTPQPTVCPNDGSPLVFRSAGS
jgi:hypothetical protein